VDISIQSRTLALTRSSSKAFLDYPPSAHRKRIAHPHNSSLLFECPTRCVLRCAEWAAPSCSFFCCEGETPSQEQNQTRSNDNADKKQTTQLADIPKWSVLLVEAVNKQKLKDGIEGFIDYALSTKERFFKKLLQYQFSESAQPIYIYLLASLESKFQNKIAQKLRDTILPKK
jgi:hypothetical protein